MSRNGASGTWVVRGVSALAMLVSASFFGIVAAQAGSGAPEPFREHRREYGVLNGTGRTIPNPKWIAISWKPENDAPFRSAQDEAEGALRATRGFDLSGKWPKKFWAAAQEYFADYQNPVKLFRASTAYGTAAVLDPTFAAGSKEISQAIGKINRGWDYLRTPPPSYLFVRRGYILNAGDEDRHDYGNLAERLLKRRPDDRGVAFAMTLEYFARGDTRFENLMFEKLDELHGGPQWRVWDGWRFAKALELRFRRKKSKEDITRAVSLAEESLAATPKGTSTAALERYLASLRRYRGAP